MDSLKMTQKFDSQVSGNTKASTLRARAFQLTLNETGLYPEVKAYITKAKIFRYLISCQEIAPSTGKPHIHIYVSYTTNKVLSLKKCLGAHVELCRGSPKQNIEYIKKEGDIIDEIGEPPHQGASYTVKDLKEIATPDELDWRIHRTWKEIHKDMDNEEIDIEDWGKEVKVYYISGPSGVGKTEMAKNIVRKNKEKYGTKVSRVKFDGRFWNGARSKGKIAIYDDFRDSHMPASEFINFIDYNRHPMNIKGSSISNDYELIIITSIIPLANIYGKMTDEPRKQWQRRIEEVILSSPPTGGEGGGVEDIVV